MNNAIPKSLPAGYLRLPIALLLGAALLYACNPFDQTEETDSESGRGATAAAGADLPASPHLTGIDLQQATYLTENTDSGTATLSDGEFRQPVASGSAAEMTIQLGKWTLGDLDGGGGVDAAAITIEQPGGSGTFHVLHALINQDDGLRDAGTAFLGDRIRVEGVSIHDRVISVAILDRYDDEPFAAAPTRPVIRIFGLEGGSLVEQRGESGAGTVIPLYPTGIDLQQATYLTENTDSGTATLSDGEFRQPVASGSAAEMTIQLGKWTLGDLDGGGGVDAAAITIEQPGGSGTFHVLHALINQDDGLRDAGTAFLGDRIRVEGVSIHDRVISVAILDRYDDEPFAAAPTRPVIRIFGLEGGSLVEQRSERESDFACDESLPDSALVIVQSPGGGEEVWSGFLVTGCSRTHESNVVWRLLSRSGEVISIGHATGGGFDGPEVFQFAVEFRVSERQIALLEVFEEDVSGGQGYPPPRAVVPLILNPI